MAPRSQPHRITWPLTAEQADNIDQMFQLLFDDVRNGSIKIALDEINKLVVTPSTLFHIGDIPYADTTAHLTSLADIATGNAIISGGVDVAPSWGKIGLTTHVSGILPVANGGTSYGSYTIGDLLYASAAGVLSLLADVATGNAIISGGIGAAPSYGKIALTTHISGVLPIVNGGTNGSTFSGNATTQGVSYFNGTSLVSDNTKLAVIDPGAGINRLRIGRSSNASGFSVTSSDGSERLVVNIDAADTLSFLLDGGLGDFYLGTKAALGGNVHIQRSGTNFLDCISGAVQILNTPLLLGTDPGGTDQLRVGGALTINDSKILTTKTAFTNGAGVGAGTIANAPAAGNPTKWIPINDNGTTRYIPAW